MNEARRPERLVVGVALLLQSVGCLFVLAPWIFFSFGDSGVDPLLGLLIATAAVIFSPISAVVALKHYGARGTPLGSGSRGLLWVQVGLQVALIALALNLADISGLLSSPRTIAPAGGESVWGVGIAFCFAAVLLACFRMLWDDRESPSPSTLARRSRMTALLAVAALTAVLFSVAGALGALSTTQLGCDFLRVDHADWELTSSDFDSASADGRTATARVLSRCGSLEGMTREEVHALIGGPREARSEVAYRLGDAPGFDDYYELVVHFDTSGRVSDAHVEAIRV